MKHNNYPELKPNIEQLEGLYSYGNDIVEITKDGFCSGCILLGKGICNIATCFNRKDGKSIIFKKQ